MKKFAVILLALTAVSAIAQAPRPAKDLIADAQKAAARENKSVFVRFTASWCGWCHRMQGVITSPKIKPIWDKYFVSVSIVVLENGDNKVLENPGGAEIMDANGGKNQGIPYFYMTDAKGKVLAVSKRPAKGADKGGNVGCPYQPEEIAYFMEMLKSAAPKMSDSERNAIKDAFDGLRKADGKP